MTPDDIANLLNDLLKTDPGAVHALIGMGVPVNEAMMKHPTAMCRVRNSMMQFPVLSVLGLLTTVAQLDGPFVIEALFDEETSCIQKFRVGEIGASPLGATC
jgi:hypothetical protein